MGMLWRLALLACLGWPVSAAAQVLVVERLESDAASPSGLPVERLQANPDGEVIFQQQRGPVWWRIRSDADIPASLHPQLLLASPYLNRVQAWVPGASGSTRHALSGPDADPRYSTRALVIALPHGLARGQAVWLRMTAPAGVPMRLSIEPLEQVHRDDLAFTAWRTFLFGGISVMLLLAVTFWLRLRERQYFYFAANLLCVLLYLLVMGGEIRAFPLLSALAQDSPQPARVLAGFAVIFTILFQRSYLQLHQVMPRVSTCLSACIVFMGAVTACNLVSDAKLWSIAGNLCVLLTGVLLLFSGVVRAIRGQREAWVLMLSWLPLLLLGMARTVELIGWWVGPAWLGHGISISLALSALLLTIGLADAMFELRRDRDRASHRADVDSVTGVSTRLAVTEYLGQAILRAAENGEPLSVAFIDVDHFKAINDRHGHAIGDECLRILAARVRRQLRSTDSLGRYGGDEMLAVMPGMDLEQARLRAEAMRNTVDVRPVEIGDVQLVATLSIGVAQWLPGESPEALLERADKALYASKAGGRNRTHLSPGPGMETTQEASGWLQ